MSVLIVGFVEPECPIGAIVSDTVDIENNDKWLFAKQKFSALWPNINKKKIQCQNIKKYEKMKNKLENHFQKNHLNNMPKKKKLKKGKKIKKIKKLNFK